MGEAVGHGGPLAPGLTTFLKSKPRQPGEVERYFFLDEVFRNPETNGAEASHSQNGMQPSPPSVDAWRQASPSDATAHMNSPWSGAQKDGKAGGKGQSTEEAPVNRANLYIKGLPRRGVDTNALARLFEGLGHTVLRSKVLPAGAGKSTSAAMVELASPAQAEKAIASLNNKSISAADSGMDMDCTLEVLYAYTKQPSAAIEPGEPKPRVLIEARQFAPEVAPRKICKYWFRNPSDCNRGVACTFAHGVQELQPAFIATCGVSRFHHHKRPIVMCRYFADSRCGKGLQCTFAHGQQEMKEGS